MPRELKIKAAKGQTTNQCFPKILMKFTKYENPIEFVKQVSLKQTGDCFKERTKSNIHLDYQNTEGSLNVHRAILPPGLDLSEIAPSAKVRRSNIELLIWHSKIYECSLYSHKIRMPLGTISGVSIIFKIGVFYKA